MNCLSCPSHCQRQIIVLTLSELFWPYAVVRFSLAHPRISCLGRRDKRPFHTLFPLSRSFFIFFIFLFFPLIFLSFSLYFFSPLASFSSFSSLEHSLAAWASTQYLLKRDVCATCVQSTRLLGMSIKFLQESGKDSQGEPTDKAHPFRILRVFFFQITFFSSSSF